MYIMITSMFKSDVYKYVLMLQNLSEKSLVNHKTHFDLQKMVRQEQAVSSYCFASWESFLNNSWYFYKIATPIRAETSEFHIFRLFHNTFLSSIYMYMYVYICIYTHIYMYMRVYLYSIHDISLVAKQYWGNISKSLANIDEILVFTLGC